ncbi:Patatin-like phospholipase domain-containing protein 2 [Dermatophagoides pteronyssinus]|uniref:Patatin-like phospholipase domain-containing protein 2 n=1 Tax=Dermatophagoides pteronyssinus TaxID=6956 RepID=A0ABQ8IQ44_DERPT|nr:Patatin-like phospholipase domain-containing protein 2 [Dermatophagoides pteronyssinus]
MEKLDTTKPISFSFSGCGFMGLYHVGVASCLREYAPISPDTKFLGASAGSLAAASLVCDMPLGESTSEILNVAMRARARALGPFHPSFDINRILYDLLMRTLPDDAHIRANGRFYISVTRVSDGKNVIINKFKSKEELIKALQCSCFIPIWSGLIPPKFNGISYIDGGCTNNLPILDENTITVSPFSGETDICPQDDTFNLFQFNFTNNSMSISPSNIYRISRILFPAHPETLSKICQQGFDDALRYLQRNNKISCTRCLAIHFTLEKEEINKYHRHHKHHANCRDCEYRRQIAILDSLPESVVEAIQEACNQVNNGIINWLFRHPPMKLLSILSIPYLLPIDITIALFSKIYEKLPDIQKELKDSFMRFISLLKSLLVKIESNRYFYSAKFTCQLAVKEFDYTSEENLTKIRKSSSHSKSMLMSDIAKQHQQKQQQQQQQQQKPQQQQQQSLLKQSFSKSFDLKDVDSVKNRKTSYAGHEINVNRNKPRRRSMIEIGSQLDMPPERVISQLNFDLKLDVKPDQSNWKNIDKRNDDDDDDDIDGSSSLDSKVLDIDINEIDQNNAIEIANKALNWEKEILEKCHDRLSNNDGNFDRMVEITRKNDAVMAYYYTDENNKVQFTELFKIRDEDLDKLNDKENNNSNDDSNSSNDDLQYDQITMYKKDNDDGLIESSTIPQQFNNIKHHH